MRIEIPFKILKGKIISNGDRIRNQITSLDDNNYVMIIKSVNPLKSPRDYQNAFFAMVDTCVSETGNPRYVIHDAFKKVQEVDSTADFTISEWQEYLEKFRLFAYNNMNIIV